MPKAHLSVYLRHIGGKADLALTAWEEFWALVVKLSAHPKMEKPFLTKKIWKLDLLFGKENHPENKLADSSKEDALEEKFVSVISTYANEYQSVHDLHL